jgi:surface polysaccharide O-acyltransferase-like enzyme
MPDEKEKVLWMDNLRAMSTVGVIVLHSCYPLVGIFDMSTHAGRTWWVGNVCDATVRFCVPVFLMLTGALLLGRNVSLRFFLKKRYNRLLLPLIFWSIVYMLFNYDYASAHTFSETAHWIYLQLKDGAAQHMWYVYMILGLYLFIPIINKWITNSTESEILFFLAIWIFILLKRSSPFSYFAINIDLSYFSGYLGYVLLGYYLSVKQFKSPYIVMVAAGIFLAATSVTILGTYYRSLRLKDFDNFYYTYLSINVMMASSGIFLFVKNYRYTGKQGVMSRLTGLISKYSYGIYLVHILVLSLLNIFKINCYSADPIIAVPATSAICLCISLLIVWLVSKIPLGRYVSG